MPANDVSFVWLITVKQEGSQETQEHDEQDDGGDPLAVAIKQEPEDDSLGGLCHSLGICSCAAPTALSASL